MRLYLASGARARAEALARMGLAITEARAMAVDETPARAETPVALTMRLARAKAEAMEAALAREGADAPRVILGYDTIASVGRRLLGKPADADAARRALALVSGRAARLTTAVCALGSAMPPRARARAAQMRIRFKRLDEAEIRAYLAADAWRGRAGGLDLEGRAAAFVRGASGAWRAAEGTPARETMATLAAAGWRG